MHAVKLVLAPRPTHLALAEDVVFSNAAWVGAKPRLSVAIPAFRCDASFLLHALAACRNADQIEVVIYDDGSRDPHLRNRHEAAAERVSVPARVVSAVANLGRAGARNLAAAHARSNWILFLDADMTPDDLGFIDAYLAASETAEPKLIVGGISIRTASTDRRYALHRWQTQTSECLPASVRARAPGRNVFTGNVLVHRDVLDAVPFDEGFAGWGWEDTDWGLSVVQHFAVHHIDNTATHTGLDTDSALLSKYARSAGNFARLATRHPEEAAAMPLHRAARLARRLPARNALATLTARAATNAHLPVSIRGRALKLWRALAYADAM